MTMASQLWRTVLSGSSDSPDRQQAAPDEEGRYGELMEAIDEVVAEAPARRARAASWGP